ncbi:MAG: monovalent cation/H(+) antiporter subunit G [Defluviitaleaceae bacterium]|nr:monovalent cation/H(+) antiporter subunit G [Defluviitaleaceae bacterium]
MENLLHIISNIFIVVGTFFILIGVIAIFKFKDFFSRILSTSKIDTVGAITILSGLAIRHGISWFSAKTILLMILILIINPLKSHTLLRYAVISGHKNKKAKGNKEVAK